MARKYTGRKYWINMQSGVIYIVEFKNGVMVKAGIVDRCRPTRAELDEWYPEAEMVEYVQARAADFTTYDFHSGAGTQYEKDT